MCSEGFVTVSRVVIESSVNTLEKACESCPCSFVAVALGSVAKGEATPYSDLEYAFIVEKDNKYFTKLAVDTYFKIGNMGETPLKCFDIIELKKRNDLACNAADIASGYKIDGITEKAGNMPTGNGKLNGQTLTLTVDDFMALYQREAELPLGEIAGDKSDMLSSTVVIYTNEGEKSQLHADFLKARNQYELTKAANNNTVRKKRHDSFVMDINSYTFLPDFIQFQPPDNLKLEIKTAIFRYPTLLANNIKMCLGWDFRYSWETFASLHSQKLLTTENYRYICIVLAISIYLRTRAYLSQRTQAKFVTLSAANSVASLYELPRNLFVILGCLLIPIKRSIKDAIDSSANAGLVCMVQCLFNNVKIDKTDCWAKVEVCYFAGLYSFAIDELSIRLGVPIDSVSPTMLLESQNMISRNINTKDKAVELVSYLLYHTEQFDAALKYFEWLIEQQQGDTGLYKLLAAHCQNEIEDYQSARRLLDQVKNI